MPSQLRGAISTLMLKVKQQDDIHAQPAFRSIGMLPALYRVWARLRRSAAREWEYHHRRPCIAHQAGHSIVELVYAQSLECEFHASSEVPQHSAQVLWDLSNYYEHVDRECLAQRAAASGFP
eukprot:8360092-Pyramimonas_sp.AAC.1